GAAPAARTAGNHREPEQHHGPHAPWIPRFASRGGWVPLEAMRPRSGLAVLLCFAACKSGGTGMSAGNPEAGAGENTPLPGNAGAWTWSDVPGMKCDDGSPTGVAINPAPSGSGP